MGSLLSRGSLETYHIYFHFMLLAPLYSITQGPYTVVPYSFAL
jgi:hypothetical protein